jgi:hypothetical protein
MLNKIKEWLSYPSSKTAIISIAGALGIAIEPTFIEYIVAAAMAIIGIVDLFKSDVDVVTKKKK